MGKQFPDLMFLCRNSRSYFKMPWYGEIPWLCKPIEEGTSSESFLALSHSFTAYSKMLSPWRWLWTFSLLSHRFTQTLCYLPIHTKSATLGEAGASSLPPLPASVSHSSCASGWVIPKMCLWKALQFWGRALFLVFYLSEGESISPPSFK